MASIAAHVDEIVIVDTGSTDSTLAIARSYDATVLERVWRNDFAWARNEALAAASGDWILYIDADERLILPDGGDLAEGLDPADILAARVGFRPKVNSTPFREHRLFRNSPRIRFRGTMHETVMPDLALLIKETGGRVVDTRAEIQHLGYEGEQSHKHARNLPLLRAALKREPGRLYYWHHLVSTLEAIGEVDEAMVTATKVAERMRQTEPTGMERPIASLLLCTYARLLHARGHDAMPEIEAGLAYYPEHAYLRLIKAQVLIDRNEPALAITILEELAAIDGATYADETLSHDRRIFDVWAHDLLGVALLRLGRRNEAAASFERAAAGAPDDLSYKAKALAIRPSSGSLGKAANS
ncbi:MAG: glycosyltransferase [Mesorhizobium sp.]|nr:glycosyltransferase [Mesorhizobium sp.]